MGSRPFVSTCSARLRLCLWLRSALVRPLCLSPLATSPDLSLDLLPPPSGGPPRLPTRANSPTTWARGKPPSPSPLATSLDSSLDPLLLPNGGLPKSPTRVSSPTTWVRGKPPSPSPLATSPDWSLDPLLLPNGGPPRSLTRASLPTMLARGLPLSTPPVSLLPPAPTTPSATWPLWFPLATSTLPATPPESVLLSAQDIPTAKLQGCTLCASRAPERLHNEN